MKKDNVIAIKTEDQIQCFSFEVKMLCHIIANNEEEATAQLNEKGGVVTKREIKLLNSVTLFKETKEIK